MHFAQHLYLDEIVSTQARMSLWCQPHSKLIDASNRKNAFLTMRPCGESLLRKIVEYPNTTNRSVLHVVLVSVALIDRRFVLHTGTRPMYVPPKISRKTKSKIHEQKMASVCEWTKRRVSTDIESILHLQRSYTYTYSLQTSQQLHANEK